MLYFTRWKIIAILISVVAGIILALPNVLPVDIQKYLAAHTIARPMTLGLDLQGGSNVLLEIDRNDLINKLLEQLTAVATSAPEEHFNELPRASPVLDVVDALVQLVIKTQQASESVVTYAAGQISRLREQHFMM